MQKIFFLLVSCSICLLISCNQGKKETANGQKNSKQSEADSLMEGVNQGHDAAMAKYGKMQGLRDRIKVLLDSIDKLPAKAREAAAPYKEQLNQTATSINSSLAAMDKWMEEFNMDSALNNLQQRIDYLGKEKIKVSSIKETFLKAYQQADSLVKKHF